MIWVFNQANGSNIIGYSNFLYLFKKLCDFEVELYNVEFKSTKMTASLVLDHFIMKQVHISSLFKEFLKI